MKISNRSGLLFVGILFASACGPKHVGLAPHHLAGPTQIQSTVQPTPPPRPVGMPPSFPYRDGSAVFVDMTRAQHVMSISEADQTATSVSTLEWFQFEAGYPVFDLVPEPASVQLDGAGVSQELVSTPDRATSVRVIGQPLGVGFHRAEIRNNSVPGVSYVGGKAYFLSDINDWDDRALLEQYLPANLEFDSVPTEIAVHIVSDSTVPTEVKANGLVTRSGPHDFRIQFPDYYSASSLFFHFFPEGRLGSVQSEYVSIDGRTIPIDVYGLGRIEFARSQLEAFVAESRRVLSELERDFGPWPHERVLVSAMTAGRSMEFSGATHVDIESLSHELMHSYFARSVLPANGNALWLDEAIVMWRDRGYREQPLPTVRSGLAAHSPWVRATDQRAYYEGEEFLGFLSSRMNASGTSLRDFLRTFFARHSHSAVTTEMFQRELEAYARLDFSHEFNRVIYGGSETTAPPTLAANGD